MAQPKLQAQFFIMPDGRAVPKAHVIPRARGGQNDDSNLQVLCISCNTAKGAR